MQNSRLFAVFALVVGLPGCAAAPASEPAPSEAVAAQAPALGKADSGDSADHACHVVLREVARLPAASGDGYQTKCSAGVCNWVFTGHVDVSREALPQDGDVRVLYHLSGDGKWWEVPAKRRRRRAPRVLLPRVSS